MKKPSKLFLLLLAVASLAAGLVALVFVGNPQWHKWIYIAQLKAYGEQPQMPAGFTGIWNSWTKDGVRSRQEFLNGEPHGPSTTWWPSGWKATEGQYAYGKPIGVHTVDNDQRDLDRHVVHSQIEYTATGGVHTIYHNSGQKLAQVIVNEKDRIRVTQNWDTNGIFAGTRTVTWDEQGNVQWDAMVRPEGASNKTSAIGTNAPKPQG